jgi:hypothetical protein
MRIGIGWRRRTVLSLRSVGHMLKLRFIQSQSGEVHRFAIMSQNSADCNMKKAVMIMGIIVEMGEEMEEEEEMREMATKKANT